MPCTPSATDQRRVVPWVARSEHSECERPEIVAEQANVQSSLGHDAIIRALAGVQEAEEHAVGTE